MIKKSYVVLAALVLLPFATSLYSQTGTGGGCVDSPEAPTALLMLIGSVGIFYGPFALKKVLCRCKKK